MAGNDGLFRALQMFQQSVGGLVQQKAIMDANAQVHEIKSSMMKEEEKIQALRQVANDFTMRLSGMGADPQRIQQVSQAIAPQRQLVQSLEQGLFSDDPNVRSIAEKAIKQKQGFELDKIEAMSSNKEEKQYANSLQSYQKQFTSLTKDVAKARNQARSAMTLLDSNSKLTASAIGTLMARASGEVGNLTEAERSIFKGKSDLISKVQRAIESNTLSELPETDKKSLRELAQLYFNSADQAIEEGALTIAGQAKMNPYFQGKDTDFITQAVSGGRVKKYRDLNPAAESADRAMGNSGLGVAAPGSLKSLLKPRPKS